jgi:hypothetical protein
MSMLFFADCVNKLTAVFSATITRHARVCRGYLTFEHAPESLQKTRPVMIVAENHVPIITRQVRGAGGRA